MTVVTERPEMVSVAGPGRRWWSALASPGWIPLLVVLVAMAALLRYYGVGGTDQVKFAAYTVLAGTLPGVLIWRALQGRAGYLPLDAAFGTTIGFAVELPVYMLTRLLGVPVAVVVWPILTVLLFAAVPRLRRHWRGSGERLPLTVSWTVALAFLFVLGSLALSSFRWNSLTEPYQSTMSMDFPFQFALLGEFKHQVPLDTPWVTGTALQYHWYVYAHGAAASWLTGIEPQTLILRLLPLPMVAAFLLVMVAVVQRISGRWWAGSLAVVLTLLGVAVSPFAWTDRPIYTGVITDNIFVSPTQTYAALFFVAVVHVLTGIVRAAPEDRRRPLPWLTFTVLVGAVAGAKATFVPMVVCGLLLAVALRLIFRRQVGAELVALGITLFWFAFAQVMLYGSGTQGTEVNPLQTVKWTVLGQAVMGRQGPPNPWDLLIPLTLLGIFAMSFGWAGLVGLLRREWRLDPAVHVMLGFAAAGIGGLWIFAHPGLSQTYFARSATPYLAMLSAIGLAALIPAGKRLPGWFVRLAAGGSLLAAVSLVVIQETVGSKPPVPQFSSWSLGRTLLPYGLVLLCLVVIVTVVVVLARRARLGRVYTVGALVVVVLATAVTSGVAGLDNYVRVVASGSELRNQEIEKAPHAMPKGAIKAGRWLRDHSAPGDVVATNSHCRTNIPGCDSRDFWLAAYSERQVVLEGWSYTEQAFETGGLWDRTLAYSKFWDPQLLAANDAVFYQPSAANVASFTGEHGVRWLVAVRSTVSPDPTVRKPVSASPALAQFATERFRAGNVTIYEVAGGA
ncbi:hypothetical protein ACWKSP_10250 [Micromonosporaceae bacterium Da 78-11]